MSNMTHKAEELADTSESDAWPYSSRSGAQAAREDETCPPDFVILTTNPASLRLSDRNGAQDQGDCPGDAAEQARWDDAVELSADGASAGREQIHGEHHLAQPQLETAPPQELQALARRAVYGEADRCGGAVPESPGRSRGTVHGREDPDPGPGSHAAWIAYEKGPPGDDDPRLRAQWHDLPVRCPGGLAGESHRSVLYPSPPSGVSQIHAPH